MSPERSGREVSQQGNVLGLPLSSLRTGGNPVLCKCSLKFVVGGGCWITYAMRVQPGSWPRCRNVLRVIWSVLRLHKECNPYSSFLPQRFGSSSVSFFCSHYCCFGDGVSWTMRCSCVLLSSWQTDKNFLRSATGRRELVIFKSVSQQKVTTCNDIKVCVRRGGQKDRRTLTVPLACQTPEGPSPEVR